MPDSYCLLCGNRNKLDSYYSFPKNEEYRKKWLEFCGIEAKVLNTVTKLCSNHFKDEDIIRRSTYTLVKPNAVPCVKSKKRKVHKDCSAIKHCEDSLMKVQTTNVDLSAYQGHFEYVGVNEDHSVLFEEPTVNISETSVNKACKLPNCESSQCVETPITSPRYFGDIKTPHIQTPRRAKTAIQLASRIIAKQRRQIKSLQQARNRLITRMRTMESTIKCLKQRNAILERTENLRVFFTL